MSGTEYLSRNEDEARNFLDLEVSIPHKMLVHEIHVMR